MSDAESEEASRTESEEVSRIADEERDLGEVLENATEAIASLEERLGDVENLEELPGDAVESVLSDVRDLVEVADELEDLFETIDLGELWEVIDVDELRESIHLGEIPDTLADRDEGLDDVVDVPHLLGALNLLSAWNAADLGQLWEDKRELDDAIDDLTDEDGEDGGLADRAVSAVTGDDDDEDDEWLDGDSRLTDEEGDVFDTSMKDVRGSFDVASNPEAYQTFIQQQATEGIDEFRDALLRVHGKFERLYEYNRERMRTTDTSTNSRNPTAVSTIPVDRRDLGGGARYSTVPRQVKYSTAPTRRRIYGRRFELERKRRGYE